VRKQLGLLLLVFAVAIGFSGAVAAQNSYNMTQTPSGNQGMYYNSMMNYMMSNMYMCMVNMMHWMQMMVGYMPGNMWKMPNNISMNTSTNMPM